MGKQRSRQLQDGRGFIKDGSVVGDRYTQRKQRGEDMVLNDQTIKRENYDFSWFHPTEAQNKILKNMAEKDCTLVDAPSGCGKSSTVIYQALKWLQSGYFNKIVFIKTGCQLGVDDVGFLGTNEAKFDYPLKAMRSIFEDFMSPEKLAMEEKLGRIEFMFPNWLGGSTFGSHKDGKTILIIDEMQWFTPDMVKLVLERPSDDCKTICMFDSDQRYSSKKRQDGAKDLLNRISTIEDGVRIIQEDLFGYTKLSTNENKRGALSRRITELYKNFDFDNQ